MVGVEKFENVFGGVRPVIRDDAECPIFCADSAVRVGDICNFK
jgi:hypothetical protein